MSIERKPGRPANDENRDDLIKITFKVDPETLKALEAIEATLHPNLIRGRRSIALRQIITEAYARLQDGNLKPIRK